MFDIGWSEMALILLVALVVIGPRDLPRVARTMGKWVAKGRAMAREFQTAIEDMAREAELDKVKSEIEKAGRTNLGKTIENTIDPTGELGQAFDPNAKSAPKTATNGAGGQAAAEPKAVEPKPRAERGRGRSPRRARRARSPSIPCRPSASRRRRPPSAGRGRKRPERETVPADPS